jgi:hypothetical protein
VGKIKKFASIHNGVCIDNDKMKFLYAIEQHFH